MQARSQKKILLPSPSTSTTPNTSHTPKSSGTKAMSRHCARCSNCCSSAQPGVHAINKPSNRSQDRHHHSPFMQCSQLLPHIAGQQPINNNLEHSHLHGIPHHLSIMPQTQMMSMGYHEPRLHPYAPAPVLQNLGRGPEPLFGWESVIPLNHLYGQPKYMKHVKPDYRRFCFSVGKADVPFAAMPGGPMWGMDVTMAPQMVGSHRW